MCVCVFTDAEDIHSHLDICPDRAINNEQTNLKNGLGAEESSRGFVDIDVFLKQTLHFLKSLWHLYREVLKIPIPILLLNPLTCKHPVIELS